MHPRLKNKSWKNSEESNFTAAHSILGYFDKIQPPSSFNCHHTVAKNFFPGLNVINFVSAAMRVMYYTGSDSDRLFFVKKYPRGGSKHRLAAWQRFLPT